MQGSGAGKKMGAGRDAGGAARRRHWMSGRRAESIAVLWLRLQGYRILARNWRAAGGEVDILAFRSRTLVAVEVKQRADRAGLDQAAEAVAQGQRRRIARAALAYLQRNPAMAGTVAPRLRFDLILVRRGWPRHLRDAWRPDM